MRRSRTHTRERERGRRRRRRRRLEQEVTVQLAIAFMVHSKSKRRQLHALAIPLPAQGHINPLMRFCKRLASQESFTITFVDIDVITDDQAPSADQLNKQEMNACSASHAVNDVVDAVSSPIKPERADCEDHMSLSLQEQTRTNAANASTDVVLAAAAAADNPTGKKLDIRRVHIPMKMSKLGKGMTLFEAAFQALESLSPLFEELLSRLIDEDPPITCLISDLYTTRCTQKLADKFCIPRIAVHTTSQSLLVFKNHLLEGTISLDKVLNVVTSKEAPKEDIFVEGVPGLPTLRNRDLMDYHTDNVFFYDINIQILKETKERAHAIVVNCIQELEEPGFQVNIGNIPVYAVGPLVDPLDKDISTSLWKEDIDCVLWLNEQPAHSVLYISFGSFITLSKAQFEEIVAGLISSQQRFLLVFRPNLVSDVSYSTLHADMLSQSHGRGCVVEWAPQTMVLSHPSVGGFLTHCGWNSAIEAISFGVPMLCFPYMSDQPLNAKLIIEEWKVGLGFKMCKESGLLERDEVEKVIRALMVDEEGKTLQRNAKNLKEISHRNLLPESTPSKNIKALVDSLR